MIITFAFIIAIISSLLLHAHNNSKNHSSNKRIFLDNDVVAILETNQHLRAISGDAPIAQQLISLNPHNLIENRIIVPGCGQYKSRGSLLIDPRKFSFNNNNNNNAASNHHYNQLDFYFISNSPKYKAIVLSIEPSLSIGTNNDQDENFVGSKSANVDGSSNTRAKHFLDIKIAPISTSIRTDGQQQSTNKDKPTEREDYETINQASEIGISSRPIWLMVNSVERNLTSYKFLEETNLMIDKLLINKNNASNPRKYSQYRDLNSECQDIKRNQRVNLSRLRSKVNWKPIATGVTRSTKLIIPLRSAQITYMLDSHFASQIQILNRQDNEQKQQQMHSINIETHDMSATINETNNNNIIRPLIIHYKFISDESKLNFTSANRFWCRNRKFIDLAMKCNDFDDCGDGSDESRDVCFNINNGNILNLPETPATMKVIANKKLKYYDTSELHCCRSRDSWKRVLYDGSFDWRYINQTRHRVVHDDNYALVDLEPEIKQSEENTDWSIRSFCWATLIHAQYAVTTSKCLGSSPFEVRASKRYSINDKNLNGPARYIDDFYIYPGINREKWALLSDAYKRENDLEIAIVRLNAPMRLTHNMYPACLTRYEWDLNSKIDTCYATEMVNKPIVVDNNDENSGNCEEQAESDTLPRRASFCYRKETTFSLGAPMFCSRQANAMNASEGRCTKLTGIVASNDNSVLKIQHLGGLSHWLASSIEMFEQIYNT